MKKLYLIGSVIVFLLILILSLPQVGAVCTWYSPISSSTLPMIPLFQAAGLGAVLGGFLVLYWKARKADTEEDDDDNGDGESSDS